MWCSRIRIDDASCSSCVPTDGIGACQLKESRSSARRPTTYPHYKVSQRCAAMATREQGPMQGHARIRQQTPRQRFSKEQRAQSAPAGLISGTWARGGHSIKHGAYIAIAMRWA
ncbi:hypothetical protein EXIGLDRAFT_499533 [Exidia glandulosa HHB12029]|uniref:Uncharacterized protein n=1 Tax=Exidia glandulosa HHB12029 TaxID=1314781 RepID=A0A166N7Q6_EXIGL|nr:hypothetical protein EXIGLDRAFT_499533 [Exidia glandulosa HHB12029]